MGKHLELYRQTRGRARTEADAQNIRQDNISRNVSTLSGPNNPFNNPSRDNYQTYPYDYYSGTDAKIFFGDIWVDDIVTIQYNVNQTKTPIWGYASQHFDAVAKGQIIVQGTLSIAFKETGYLNIIQTLLERQRLVSGSKTEQALKEYKLKAERGIAKFIPGLETELTSDGDPGVVYSANGTPSFIRQSQTIEQILQSKLISADLGNGFGVGEKQRDFEDFAELLEDSIWGDANGRPYETKPKLKRADEFDYDKNGGIKTGRSPYSDVLNIVLTFGDINDFRAEHTIISLNDVHFQSQSMVISPDGNPIAETYTFFARDINDAIGKSSVYDINPIKLETGLDDVQISKLDEINAIQDQLVREEVPRTLTIYLRAALPRNGQWKAIAPPVVIYLDNNEISERLEDEYSAASSDEERATERYKDRNSRYRSRKLEEARTAKAAANKQKNANRQISFNGTEPLIDQMIRYVEREINEFDGKELELNNSQYIADVVIGDLAGDWAAPSHKFTMVLEQSIPASRTYKVISPTRQNFGAANIITREDLFRDIKPQDALSDELLLRRDLNTQREREEQERKAEVEERLTTLAQDRAETLKERQERVKQQIEKAIDSQKTARAGSQIGAGVSFQDEQEQLESYIKEKRDEYSMLDRQIEELTDDDFSQEDIDILHRRNRGDFQAALGDYNRFDERAEYYGDIADGLNQTYDNTFGNGAELNPGQFLSDEDQEAQLLDNLRNRQLQLVTEEDNPWAVTAEDIDAEREALRNKQLQEGARVSQESQEFLENTGDDVDSVEAENATHEQWLAQLEYAGIEIKDHTADNTDPVRFDDIQPEIGAALGKAKPVFDQFNQQLVITSANDSTEHKQGSLHYKGAAVDIRTRDLLGGYTGQYAQDIVRSLREELGDDYDVILEGDHIHLEYDPDHRSRTTYRPYEGFGGFGGGMSGGGGASEGF